MKRNIVNILLLVALAGVLYILRIKFKPMHQPTTPTETAQETSKVADLLQNTDTGSNDNGTGSEVAIDNLSSYDYEGGGEYKPFFPQTVKQALNEGKNVILYFHADRDPTDKALDSDMQKRSDRIPKNYTILKIEYDANEKLRETFSVKQQNTLIFLNKEGTESRRRSMGITSLAQIVRAINQ